MKATVSTLLILLGPLPVSASSGLCATDLHHLLRVTASREFVHHSIRLPPPPQLVVEDFTVARAGAVVGTRVADDICDSCHGIQQTVYAGNGSAKALKALKLALSANRVGIQHSCFAANAPDPLSTDVFGTYELTWDGRDGRSNTIKVVYGDPEDNVLLPPCGNEMKRILQALSDYQDRQVPLGGGCSSAE